MVGLAPLLREAHMPIFPILALYLVVSGWSVILSLVSSLCVLEKVCGFVSLVSLLKLQIVFGVRIVTFCVKWKR